MCAEAEVRVRGEDVTVTRTFDDGPFHEHCASLRRSLGKGFIRDAKGVAVGRRLLSIPCEEAAMLVAQNDPDWLEFWNTDSDSSMMRLIKRFPHWVCCEGGGLV